MVMKTGTSHNTGSSLYPKSRGYSLHDPRRKTMMMAEQSASSWEDSSKIVAGRYGDIDEPQQQQQQQQQQAEEDYNTIFFRPSTSISSLTMTTSTNQNDDDIKYTTGAPDNKPSRCRKHPSKKNNCFSPSTSSCYHVQLPT